MYVLWSPIVNTALACSSGSFSSPRGPCLAPLLPPPPLLVASPSAVPQPAAISATVEKPQAIVAIAPANTDSEEEEDESDDSDSSSE